MKASLILSTFVLLSACGVEGETDQRTMLLAEIETCFDHASAGEALDNVGALAVVDACAEQMDSYSRFNIEEMFDRRLVADEVEMMALFREHQVALREFAIRKLTTGEGEWQ